MRDIIVLLYAAGSVGAGLSVAFGLGSAMSNGMRDSAFGAALAIAGVCAAIAVISAQFL